MLGVGCWVLLVPSLASVTRDQNLSRLNFLGNFCNGKVAKISDPTASFLMVV